MILYRPLGVNVAGRNTTHARCFFLESDGVASCLILHSSLPLLRLHLIVSAAWLDDLTIFLAIHVGHGHGQVNTRALGAPNLAAFWICFRV